MESSATIPHEHVVFTEFEGGESVLVDLNTKRYYQLNETATLVWRAMEKGQTQTEIVAAMTARYDVTPERAAASVEKVLRLLRSYRLLRT